MTVLGRLAHGQTQDRAATRAGVAHATAERYAARYRREGVAGLRASRWVKPTRALEPLLDLPLYSPNLNLIERLWTFTPKTALRGKHDPKSRRSERPSRTAWATSGPTIGRRRPRS